MSKTVNVTKIIKTTPIYELGNKMNPEIAWHQPTKSEFKIELLDPDSPLTHQSCDTIEDYELFVVAGTFIKDGCWFVDEYNAVSEATPKEIAIAAAYNKIRYRVKSRFELITE